MVNPGAGALPGVNMGYEANAIGAAGLAEVSAQSPLAAILWGTSFSTTEVTYWCTGAGDVVNGYTTEAWTAHERDRLSAALDLLSRVTALTFEESESRETADFVIGVDLDEMGDTELGFFFPPGTDGAGLGLFNARTWDREPLGGAGVGPGGDLGAGGVGFATITHELLHGLGLAHPHDDGGGSAILPGVNAAFADTGTSGLNQGVFTTMSYNPGLLEGTTGAQASLSGMWGAEIGPMALDIAALQSLYGANMDTAVGDDVYEMPDLNEPGTGWRALWDAGGTDTIRYGGTRDAVIDLRAATLEPTEGGGGYLSAASAVAGGYTIAYGVVIENADAGTGDDRLQGNASDNRLFAYYGDDVLIGGAGDDELIGHRGADQIFGGTGNDWISAGRNDDYVLAGDGDDLVMAGRGDDALLGGAGNDRILGRKGRDWLDGGSGDDELLGGPGDDEILGGAGDDIISLGYGEDLFVFALGDGADLVTDVTLGRDRIELDTRLLDGAPADALGAMATETALGLRLAFDEGDSLTLAGLTLTDLPDLAIVAVDLG